MNNDLKPKCGNFFQIEALFDTVIFEIRTYYETVLKDKCLLSHQVRRHSCDTTFARPPRAEFLCFSVSAVNQMYGFKGEIATKYDARLFDLFTEGMFALLCAKSINTALHILVLYESFKTFFFGLFFSFQFKLEAFLCPSS